MYINHLIIVSKYEKSYKLFDIITLLESAIERNEKNKVAQTIIDMK